MRLFRKVFNYFICTLKSKYYSSYIDSGNGNFYFVNHNYKFNIKKSKNSILEIKGKVRLESFLGAEDVSSIILNEGSKLTIHGDFDLGSGVKIALSKNARLEIGGKKFESGSGITANTIILCNRSIIIGYDFICSWDVFISDFDSHLIEGSMPQKDVVIGNHVWIGQGSKILKGTTLEDGGIIASGAIVLSGNYKKNTLYGGIPAVELKKNIYWKRDLN